MGISSILVLKFAFLPTPSVRRATCCRTGKAVSWPYFYPRPP